MGGYFFISSFFMPSLDMESLDIESFDMLSFFMESFDIESLDIESFDIVSFFMLSWAKAAGDSPSPTDTMDADRMSAARLIMRAISTKRFPDGDECRPIELRRKTPVVTQPGEDRITSP